MKALFNWEILRMVGLVAAIVVIAQLASIPIAAQLQKRGLPR